MLSGTPSLSESFQDLTVVVQTRLHLEVLLICSGLPEHSCHPMPGVVIASDTPPHCEGLGWGV